MTHFTDKETEAWRAQVMDRECPGSAMTPGLSLPLESLTDGPGPRAARRQPWGTRQRAQWGVGGKTVIRLEAPLDADHWGLPEAW